MAGEIKQDLLFRWITDIGAFAEGIERGLAKMDEMDKSMKKTEKSTSFLNRTLSTFVANIGVELVGAATQAIGKFKQLFGQFTEFAKGATMQAARIEVQWRTLSLTAGNAGQSIEDMTKHIQALRAAGIKTGEALEIVTQFLANELPVENITELARRAQDMAVVIGRDSTEAFQRFNNFLQTGNSEWIRTMGITKTANQMLMEYAQTQGKVVKALTARERKEALVQGLMKETMRYEGAYEEAMKDPYKRWTSLPRLISNVTEVLGAVFVPMMGTVVDIFSDALEKIERLFRVTKKEAKETGATIGEWKEGFLKLRAVVQAFANWFMSLWERLTSGFNERTESMMDRFVNAIIRGVKAAADALRRFARFLASVFGGRAPGEVTAAAPTAPAAAAPTAAPAPPTAAPAAPAPPTTAPAAPAVAAPTPASTEDVARYNDLMAKLVDWNKKLAAATAAVAKARAAFAKAEERLEKASEKVYDIRRKIAKLELAWSEIPERFIRGRKRQLQMELMAAEHEEHERQKEANAARERLQAAEAYQREVQQMTESLRREAERLGEAIAEQNRKYEEWVNKLKEAEQVSLEEPIQAIVNEFESLDDLTAQYLEEIEGALLPAFASIEESVKSIVSSLGAAWDKAKGIAGDVWDFLGRVKGWFDGLPEWAQKILKTGMLAIALNWITGGAAGAAFKTILTTAFSAAGLVPGVGWAIAAGGVALFIAIKPFLSPEVQESWKKAWATITGEATKFSEMDIPWLRALGEAAQTTIEHTPIMSDLLKWIDSWDVIPKGIEDLFRGRKDSMADATSEGLEKPLVETMERAAEEIVGASIVPEMVESILDWFDTLQLDLTPILDSLTGKLQILEQAFAGLIPTMKEFGFASGGNFRVNIVNLQNSTFGEGVDEWQIKDWIQAALRDMMD